MKFLKLLFSLCLCTTALLGDYIVFQSKYSSSLVFRAVTDSAVHASIGFFSSLLFFSREPVLMNGTNIHNVLLCTAVSSLIDVDHFIVAKSIYLKDLANLKQRGFLHCTTLWLLLTTTLLTYCHIYKKTTPYTSIWMLMLAFTSHHIRDANRRGLWMFPFGHTPALSKHLYVILLATLPHVFSVMCNYMRPVKTFEYTSVV